jgi:hypothetical protein
MHVRIRNAKARYDAFVNCLNHFQDEAVAASHEPNQAVASKEILRWKLAHRRLADKLFTSWAKEDVSGARRGADAGSKAASRWNSCYKSSIGTCEQIIVALGRRKAGC